MLAAVSNNCIEFVTTRPPSSQFAALDRHVVVTGPTELVKLSGMGDVQVLDDIVELLQYPDRAWAAIVLLAAMTRREGKIIDSFAATPDEWWNSLGKTAYERWKQWLEETREKLVWDSQNKIFVERK